MLDWPAKTTWISTGTVMRQTYSRISMLGEKELFGLTIRGISPEADFEFPDHD
jgi:hypothetical protein